MNTPADSVAVLSDIHGVLPVLDAILAQPEVQGADLIVACGDHAAGPQPVQVLDRLTVLRNAVLVRGNADRDLVALARGEYPPDEEAYPVDAWAAAQLSPAHVDLLAGLPPTRTVPPGPRTTCAPRRATRTPSPPSVRATAVSPASR